MIVSMDSLKGKTWHDIGDNKHVCGLCYEMLATKTTYLVVFITDEPRAGMATIFACKACYERLTEEGEDGTV